MNDCACHNNVANLFKGTMANLELLLNPGHSFRLGNILVRILNQWRHLPSRWVGHVTVAYELLLVIRHHTDLGGRKAAAISPRLSPFICAIVLSASVLSSIRNIARFLPLRTCSALYSFLCRRSTLGMLSAVFVGPALTPDMQLSPHCPLFLYCFAHDSLKCKTARGDNT